MELKVHGWLAAATVLCLITNAFSAPPTFQTDFISEIPDLVQTDPKGNFARDGKSYCAPVAISNSLLWLKAGGTKPFSDIESQYEAVRLLAGENFMNTDPVKGTGITGVIKGIEQYVKQEIKDESYTLEYIGWRPGLRGYRTDSKESIPLWIRHFVARNKSAWVNLGWYRHHKETNEYERIGGHWVTVVGYGKDESGKENNRIIVIHDPSPRTGKDPHNYVLLTELKSGTLVGKYNKLPQSAVGKFQLEGGMHIKSSADLAILDAVVGLDLTRAGK